uniref:Protein CDV3 homolog n=1 Tax=Phallusia mammillata TaxID=59560 RepID=A0A6F9D9I9_9ASCI|nr:protein CDV3 homolog [Phallusia mammillata]
MSEEHLEVVADDDGSLDNFFKKKDKKGKKKSKSKKSEPVDDLSEVPKPKKKETELKKEGDAQEKVEEKDDQEEWDDFEDESQRDYSDLKIQNLQITETEESNSTVEVPEYNEAGELLPPRQEEGPWRNVKSQDSTPGPAPVVEVKEVAVSEAPKKSGAYRPPQARMSGNLAPMSLKRGRKQQQAPEINNELDFPSLEAAAKDTVEHKGFEMVKTGNKSTASWRSNQQQNQTRNIRLDNQFSALQ